MRSSQGCGSPPRERTIPGPAHGSQHSPPGIIVVEEAKFRPPRKVNDPV